MKLNAMVLGDEVKEGKLDNGQAWKNRTLTVVEINPNVKEKLIPQVFVKIPVDDPIAGPGTDGASLFGTFVDLGITDVKQDERSKRVVFTGSVLAITGKMEQVAFTAPKPKETAKAA